MLIMASILGMLYSLFNLELFTFIFNALGLGEVLPTVGDEGVWPNLEALTLFQVNICNFPYPVSYLSQTSIEHIRPLKLVHGSNT